jgi:hypothetical protein
MEIFIMEKKQTEVAVFDYLQAAVLKAKGIRFLGARPGNGRRCELLFDSTNGDTFQVLDAHRNGGVSVNSADMVNAVREMKDAIFSAHNAR